ncbi:hypothetical protein WNY78_10970 [Psychroserpens sp. AS72]|uniref:hypothetical protein n=1 Tax=Psychroserpens sp. AS72 TaxID=3135775 RepID=UPI00316DEDD4
MSKFLIGLTILICANGFSQKVEYGNSTFDKNKVNLEYVVSKYDGNQEAYIDEIKQKKLNPKNCAIVLIDVWDMDFLKPMVNEFLNPVIKDLSSIGFNIIYAPSQEKQHKDLLQVENGITFYNDDIMDSYIEKNDIKHIFYLGFDALYCVIDKPNGLFAFKNRNSNKNLNYYAFDKGLSSYSIGMRAAALRLFKKNDIGVIVTDKVNFNNYNSDKINKHLRSKTVKKLPAGKNLVLIFKNDKVNDTLNNFEANLKKANINYLTVSDNKLYTKDKVLTNDSEFLDLLIKQEIDNIYYAGYYLNNEILWSEFGVTNLYIHKRYMGIKELPKIFFVNDLVYIAKTLKSDSIIEKFIILNHYRGIKNIFSKQLIKLNLD